MSACAALVLWDRSRISQEQRDRGWNSASFGAAVFTFSPWCVVAHFWVTRRSIKGILLGFFSLFIVVIAIILFNSLLMWVLGVSGD